MIENLRKAIGDNIFYRITKGRNNEKSIFRSKNRVGEVLLPPIFEKNQLFYHFFLRFVW